MAQGVPGRLRSRIFLTFRHYKGGRSSAKRTDHLYPRRNPWYSLSEVESTSGHMVLSGVPRKKPPVTPPGIDPGTLRLVAQRLNHYATPGPYTVTESVKLVTVSKIFQNCNHLYLVWKFLYVHARLHPSHIFSMVWIKASIFAFN